jgi:PhzF family phenazine biosynthesis protein
MRRRFAQVDVFTDRPFFGNALAVVVDGGGRTTEDMQRVANWTNLSETTFLLPPNDGAADYRVQIFTPGEELPFAGHPTLGTCQAWPDHGGVASPRTPAAVVRPARCESTHPGHVLVKSHRPTSSSPAGGRSP